MAKLNTTWIVEDLIDYEYKKYKVLDYLQKVQYKFDDYALYPYFTDLICNYNIIKQLKMRGELTENTYGNNLSSLELIKFKAQYERLLEINKSRDDISKTLNFAIEEMRPMVMLGKELYDLVQKSIDVEVVAHNKQAKSGYLFIDNDKLYVYEYRVCKIKPEEEPINALKTKLVREYPLDDIKRIEDVKNDILAESKISKPNLYYITASYTYPMKETLIPIVKRLMIKRFINK